MGLSALLPTLLFELGATQAHGAGSLRCSSVRRWPRIIEAIRARRRVHPISIDATGDADASAGLVILFCSAGRCWRLVFAVLYGAGNGVLTIARGTLPLAVSGPDGFGHRVGLACDARAA